MLTAEQYARVFMLFCQDHSCGGCPLNVRTEISDCAGCSDFSVRYPAEAVKIVHLWWEENRKRYPEYDRRKDKSNENDGL